MKKNIGSLMALYPTPVTVIGAMNGAKPTWTLVAHVGIIGQDVYKRQEDMLPAVDVAGSVSGANGDKSDLFAYELSESGIPMIQQAPLNMACTVVDVYPTKGFESFICTIEATYVEEEHLNAQGKPDYNTLKPVLFQFPTYEYLKTGAVIGKCLSFKKTVQ